MLLIQLACPHYLNEVSTCTAGLNASLRQLTEKLGQAVEMTYYIQVPINVEQVIQFVDSTETIASPTIVHIRLQGMEEFIIKKLGCCIISHTYTYVEW